MNGFDGVDYYITPSKNLELTILTTSNNKDLNKNLKFLYKFTWIENSLRSN